MSVSTRRFANGLRLLLIFGCAPLAWAQFPDLTVQNITVTPPNPVVGQTVQVEVELRNAGNSLPLNTFQLLLFEDFQPSDEIACNLADQSLLIEDTIPTGGTTGRFYYFDVTYATPGTKNLRAFVDGCFTVPELDDFENNLGAAAVTVSAQQLFPDLVINNITTSTATPQPGEPFNVSVWAENVGVADASSFRLTVVTDAATEPDEGPTCNAPLFEYILGPVPPNTPFSRTFSVTYPNAGNYRLWAMVDSCGGAVQESDETNNAQSRDLSVQPCADSDNDGICDDEDNCDNRQATTWYRDADNDGFGDANNSVSDCTAPTGYVADNTDCDDSDPSINPAAAPQCEPGIDRNCNGIADDLEQAGFWQADVDGDGFTDPASQIQACTPPVGYFAPSATPDPDDNDFMTPEAVTGNALSFTAPRAASGRSTPQNIMLSRNGAVPFSFAVDEASIPVWLIVEPLAGTSDGGSALLSAAVDLTQTPGRSSTATLLVTINEAAQVEVPVDVTPRGAVLTIRHEGQGGGYVTVEYDDDPNDTTNEYTVVLLVDTTQNILEGSVEIPEGRSAFVRSYTEGDCSVLNGLFDAATNEQLNDPNWYYYQVFDPEFDDDPNDFPCDGCTAHPAWVRMDGDRELVADYSLSGLACTACSALMLGFSGAGLLTTRRRY